MPRREAAGLEVLQLEACALRVEFFDVAAVVHFLRKVLWTVPGFTAEAYDEQLRRMHEHIEQRRRLRLDGAAAARRGADARR